MKKEYVKKQHYIPQFALKAFEKNKNGIPFVNISNEPIRLMYSKTMNIMVKRDFYEIKDDEGNYFFRNYIEDNFSLIESEISPNYQKFINLSLKSNFQEEFTRLVVEEEWAEIEASILLYVILTLIRGKEYINLSRSKSELPDSYKNILYSSLTTSRLITVELAKKLFIGEELEGVLDFIKNDIDESPIHILSEHILKKYTIRVCKAIGSKEFFLSDNPVIVQKFEDEDYILPITPKICIILVPMKIKEDTICIDSNIYSLDDYKIDMINEKSFFNTEKLLIISKERDIEFIRKLIKKNNKRRIFK